jgi:6-phosphogluconolactonase
VSALPDGFSGTSWAAEVETSPDGRFLYASNRGHDSLAVFRIDAESGRLTAAAHVAVGGKTPRHFTIDPSGRWLLAGHQGSGTIAVFRLDPDGGMPALIGSPVAIDKPVCLLPLPRR